MAKQSLTQKNHTHTQYSAELIFQIIREEKKTNPRQKKNKIHTNDFTLAKK